MSRRSQKIRAERREKQARRWAGYEKTHRGALHDGLANDSRISVACKKDDPPLAEGRRPWELAAP